MLNTEKQLNDVKMKLVIISFMKLMYYKNSRLVNQDNKAIVEEEFLQENVYFNYLRLCFARLKRY